MQKAYVKQYTNITYTVHAGTVADNFKSKKILTRSPLSSENLLMRIAVITLRPITVTTMKNGRSKKKDLTVYMVNEGTGWASLV